MVSSGKREMVRAGRSASRIIGDQGTTDPGGGECGSRRGQPAWQLLVGRRPGTGWASSTQAFPPLGSQPAEIQVHGQDKRKSVLGGSCPIVPDSLIGMDGGSSSVVPQCPELGKMGGGCGLPEGISGFHRK